MVHREDEKAYVKQDIDDPGFLGAQAEIKGQHYRQIDDPYADAQQYVDSQASGSKIRRGKKRGEPGHQAHSSAEEKQEAEAEEIAGVINLTAVYRQGTIKMVDAGGLVIREYRKNGGVNTDNDTGAKKHRDDAENQAGYGKEQHSSF